MSVLVSILVFVLVSVSAWVFVAIFVVLVFVVVFVLVNVIMFLVVFVSVSVIVLFGSLVIFLLSCCFAMHCVVMFDVICLLFRFISALSGLMGVHKSTQMIVMKDAVTFYALCRLWVSFSPFRFLVFLCSSRQ